MVLAVGIRIKTWCCTLLLRGLHSLGWQPCGHCEPIRGPHSCCTHQLYIPSSSLFFLSFPPCSGMRRTLDFLHFSPWLKVFSIPSNLYGWQGMRSLLSFSYCPLIPPSFFDRRFRACVLFRFLNTTSLLDNNDKWLVWKEKFVTLSYSQHCWISPLLKFGLS